MTQTKKQQNVRAKAIKQVLRHYMISPSHTMVSQSSDKKAALWAHTDIYNRTGILLLRTVAAFFDNYNIDRPTAISASPVKDMQEAERVRDRVERVAKNTLLHLQANLNRAIKPRNIKRNNGVRASSMSGISGPPELWVPVKLTNVGTYYRIEFPPEFKDLPSANIGSIKASDTLLIWSSWISSRQCCLRNSCCFSVKHGCRTTLSHTESSQLKARLATAWRILGRTRNQAMIASGVVSAQRRTTRSLCLMGSL